jgi:hypothetical protein
MRFVERSSGRDPNLDAGARGCLSRCSYYRFHGHGLRDTCLLLRDTVIENGEVLRQLAANTSPFFLYETETSRCQPAFSGSVLAKRSAPARPDSQAIRRDKIALRHQEVVNFDIRGGEITLPCRRFRGSTK